VKTIHKAMLLDLLAGIFAAVWWIAVIAAPIYLVFAIVFTEGWSKFFWVVAIAAVAKMALQGVYEQSDSGPVRGEEDRRRHVAEGSRAGMDGEIPGTKIVAKTDKSVVARPLRSFHT
jgi:hypothetical protein